MVVLPSQQTACIVDIRLVEYAPYESGGRLDDDFYVFVICLHSML